MTSRTLLFSRERLSSTVFLLVLGGAAAGTGCGGEPDDEENGSSGSNDSGAIGIDLTSGTGSDSEGATSGSIESSDGGRIDLSEEQVQAIDAAACTGWMGEGESLPAVLQLVVDTSFSMTQEAPGSRASKWEVTSSALLAAVEDLPPSVAVGLMFYPNSDGLLRGEASPSPISACIDVDGLIPIASLGAASSTQRTAISTEIRGMRPDGYTPTHDAYRYALEESLLPYASDAKKFMLLITDGAPTVDTDCVSTGEQGGGRGGPADAETQPIIDEIAAANEEHQVRTFLIGSPGSEVSSSGNGDMRPWLSQAALAGGTAQAGCAPQGPDFCHLDMTQETDFSAALTAGLAAITGQIVNQCEFKVPEPPDEESTIDPNETNLIVTWGDGSSSLILPDGQGACADGWQWKSDLGTVSLCGQTCDEVKQDEGAHVTLTFGCTTDEIVVPIR